MEAEREKSRNKDRKESEELQTMRVQLEQALNSEMILRMQLEQSISRNRPPSPDHPYSPDRRVEPSQRPPAQSTSFYTELTVAVSVTILWAFKTFLSTTVK